MEHLCNSASATEPKSWLHPDKNNVSFISYYYETKPGCTLHNHLVGSTCCPEKDVEGEVGEGEREAGPPVANQPGPATHQLISYRVDTRPGDASYVCQRVKCCCIMLFYPRVTCHQRFFSTFFPTSSPFRIMLVSCVQSLASCLLYHVSCVMSHVSCLTSPV